MRSPLTQSVGPILQNKRHCSAFEGFESIARSPPPVSVLFVVRPLCELDLQAHDDRRTIVRFNFMPNSSPHFSRAWNSWLRLCLGTLLSPSHPGNYLLVCLSRCFETHKLVPLPLPLEVLGPRRGTRLNVVADCGARRQIRRQMLVVTAFFISQGQSCNLRSMNPVYDRRL